MERTNRPSRRGFLERCTLGLGSLALASLTGDDVLAQARAARRDDPLTLGRPHVPPRVKRVIYLHMAGSPSQLDLFDEKPRLVELNGQACPAEVIRDERFAFIKGTPKILGSPYSFQRHGDSGAVMSELLPHLAGVADRITVVRSMYTDAFNHAPAQLFLQTGSTRVGRPSIGSWVTYGLGSEAENLPGFVVLISGGGIPSAGHAAWSAGFLPTVHQGVPFRGQGEPVLYVSDPEGIDRATRRRSIDAIGDLNRMHFEDVRDPEIETRIASYEMAFRMQASVPELTDIASEPDHVHALYGTEPGKASFANNCLLARRLVERGVRFVQLYHRGWDSHGTSPGDDIVHSLPARCRETDRACAALITDLAQRGLLDDTLVVWGGEFGRTPMNEERNGSKYLGRDHHPHAFTMWLAGGGLKAGTTVGATDELGYRIVEDPYHVHDLQATLLHLLGLDHTRLTYRFQGRDFRLTDVHGQLMHRILA